MAKKKAAESSSMMMGEGMLKNKIYVIRGQKVMLDYDLAVIYGYTTSAFNQQVVRNKEKFDDDFMFQLTREEVDSFVISQNVISRVGNLLTGQDGGSRHLPHAFTESGIYMLMTILKGELAVRQSKTLIRLFRAMKEHIMDNQERLEYRENLNLAIKVMKNTQDIQEMKGEIKRIDDETKNTNKRLSGMVAKSDISPVLLDFGKIAEQKEFIFLDGEPMRASELYIDIYGRAKKSIYVIDNYADIKTLRHLQYAKAGVEIVLFTDNIGKHLHKNDYRDFRQERGDLEIRFVRTEGKIHDRFVIVDYGSKRETIYHCGSSEKDAGRRLTIVSKYDDVLVREIMHGVVERLKENEELELR